MSSTNSTAVWSRAFFASLVVGMLALGVTVAAEAQSSGDVKKVQASLSDKGFNPGQIDGVMGPQTREALGQYQKSQDLPVTHHLDAQTADKLGVEPESVGGNFKSAGRNVGEGGKELGHDVKKGRPVAAGKDLGKGIGRGGKDVGKGVEKAVTP